MPIQFTNVIFDGGLTITGEFGPGIPTIGTATATGATSATVSFTAPADSGSSSITRYTATSSPGGITGTLNQSGSGTITVNGLTTSQAYTFTVTATNSFGTSGASSASNSVTPTIITGQAIYTVSSSNPTGGVGTGPVTFQWTCPVGVTSVSIVCVGAGGRSFGGSVMGGGGAALAYTNNYSVTPGSNYSVSVGYGLGASQSSARTSKFSSGVCEAQGGGDSFSNSGYNYAGAVVYGDGGIGGPGGKGTTSAGGGGGGAGGYSGQPSSGGGLGAAAGIPASATSGVNGAGGGGNSSLDGGGVGIFGQGTNGAAGGGAGSGGSGITYGGGGGAIYGSPGGTTKSGGDGVVRIIWPGNTRTFPSTNVGNF
jgi:hypothetical protein